MKETVTILPYVKAENKVGSLLLLFQSPCFTMNLLILYLKNKFENQGIRDFLINKLYAMEAAEIDYYLPQIMYIKSFIFLLL